MTSVFRLVTVLLVVGSGLLPAQEKKKLTKDEAQKIVDTLHWRTDPVTLDKDLATIKLAPGYRFLDKNDTNTVMSQIWRNPPTNDWGMIFPNNTGPLNADWAVVVERFEEEGFVKDEDADKLDADKLLKQIQESQQEANEERQKQGYPLLEIIGWAMKPHYDKEAKKLTWAIDLRVAGATEHSVNYYVRILGRRGYLVLNMLGGMEALSDIEKNTPDVLAMVNFNEGHRYADYNPKTDKVAAYGIAGLIAAGVGIKLAKLGLFALFFKKIGLVLAAGWKLIAAGCVAVSAFFKKLFGKKDTSTSQP